MYPDHYAVPEGLNIRCIGHVRWAETEEGYFVTTLWRDPEGNAYYAEDVWTPFAAPFWFSTSMSDLVPCDSTEFAEHVEDICLSIEDEQQQVATFFRYHELMLLWGFANGIALGFEQARQANITP